MITDALSEFLTASPDGRRLLAPGLVDAVGEDRLEAILASTRQRAGSLVSVTERKGGGLLIVGTRARIPVWAVAGADGRLRGLGISPANESRWAGISQGPLRWWFGMAWWSTAYIAVGVSLWTAESVAAWISSAGVLAILLLRAEGFGTPSRWSFPPLIRWAAALLVVGDALSAVRLGGLAAGGTAAASLVEPLAVLLGLGAWIAWARRHRWPEEVSEPLLFPCDSGTWHIGQGGGYGLNHHYRVPEQRGALDIVKIGPRGTHSAAALLPSDPGAYEAYGTRLFAPCAGTVTSAADGHDDQVPGRSRYAPATGNHVCIDTGKETVVLAHLKRGTVLVRTGDTVRAGDPIGEIGNSGNSTEPHLHLHAERDGIGLQLRFTGINGGLWRGRRIHWDPNSRSTPSPSPSVELIDSGP
ncbi:M23 family metallopeptidase [Streptacidiphilus sp. 4-A2]|nr:M23 family metallopeptidase [Streptacidiphilus sp. 4-A2]